MILIIANARIKGGLSGGDNIYLHMAEHVGHHRISEMMDIDFKPFFFCYVWKIIKGCWRALWDGIRYEYVYSASDFWMDSLPAFIYKLKGRKWIAGCYMLAPKKNLIYYWSQKPIRFLLNHFADVICVTTSDVFGFKKPIIAIHGGIDLNLAYPDYKIERTFDAVFVGRFHYTKGIDELMEIWDGVLKHIPNAKLAVIGDGDSEADKLKAWMNQKDGIVYYGYLEDERFDIYRRAKIVLYPTPQKYSHFSMSPVEAMACACPMIAFDLDVMRLAIEKHGLKGCSLCTDIQTYINTVVGHLNLEDKRFNSKSRLAVEYAETWDWSVHMPKLLTQINNILFNKE